MSPYRLLPIILLINLITFRFPPLHTAIIRYLLLWESELGIGNIDDMIRVTDGSMVIFSGSGVT